MRCLLLGLIVVAGVVKASSAEPLVAVCDNVITRHVPGIPLELPRKVSQYGEYRTARFAAWHPERLEMLVLTRFADTSQIHRVREPGGRREQLTFFPETVLGASAQ